MTEVIERKRPRLAGSGADRREEGGDSVGGGGHAAAWLLGAGPDMGAARVSRDPPDAAEGFC